MSTEPTESPLPPAAPQESGQDRSLPLAIGFVVLVALLLIGSNVWLAWRAHQAEWQQARVFAQNLSRAMAQQMDGLATEVGRELVSIQYELERDELSPAQLDALQPMLVNQVSLAEHLQGLFVFGRNGEWLVHSLPVQPPAANNADREYFIHHRDNPSTLTYVSKPLQSRTTGEWVIPLSRRINDALGGFAGVVLATLRVRHVQEVLQGFDVGNKGAIALLRTDGTVLTRKPFRVEDLGRTLPASQLPQFLQSRSGLTVVPSPIDGVVRLVSFEYARNVPLAAAVALSEDDILAEWRKATAAQIAGILLLLAVIGPAGAYLIRTVKMRRDADLRLRTTHEALVEAHARMEHMAEHDGLTGLRNRRAYDRRIREVMAQCRRYQRPVSVVMFDVDFFKLYNDALGHLEGDECLRRVAHALAGSIRRPGDFIARYGGEEFAIVLQETDAPGALQVARAARSAVIALHLPHPGSPFGHVTVSGGVACCPGRESETPEELLGRADTALYEAKQQGRDRIVAADSHPSGAGH
ncbi:sensor domain-containing diguanylate cyclase [Paracidovorax cattleyae]|uniref:diguanylate cyclase n=1 Tax=Paracidovorax cattleyae TaxID=80868 RepID=A0A1H0WCP4_9BURK|nr:sensor domain-containing diguanylate cyclase [Paracidovorax cattleyae]AVS74022.1 GGDEF domain-containing protein [Paracidovorax cattleyae]SDP88311.1 diguanylate cyclase (GGDEF) domain-containing protein [Paracidovorax cattleyae]